MPSCNANGVCQNPLGVCAQKCALVRKAARKPKTQLRELPMHDANGLSLQARMVWLHIRDEGGWWSAKELARDLMPGDANGPANVTPCLRTLTERGHLVSRRVELQPTKRTVLTFGVTAACSAPVGWTLEPA